MKKLLTIATVISSCILLFSCEKEPVDIIGQRIDGLNLDLFGGGWCKQAPKPVGSTADSNHQTNSTEIPIKTIKFLKGRN